LRIVFLGSGVFAIPSFEALLQAGHELAALVTQPDRERGRGRVLAPPPLKPVAQRRGVHVLQPARAREPGLLEELRSLAPELQVVVAYGQILPRAVLDVPPRGTLNVHASLLPAYRGAAPIQWAIVNGETETGVTTMLLDEGLDTGPTLLARRTPIGPRETAGELETRLARLGAEALLDTIRGVQDGTLVPVPQDPARATHAPLIQKQDGAIDWRMPAEAIARRVRGFHPWPGAYARLDGRILKVLRAEPAQTALGAAPGTVAAVEPDSIVVACGAGSSLALLEVQPESRRPMPASAFAAGARLRAGARFEEAGGSN
jgi:methionyl-tRNA formyltransferase